MPKLIWDKTGERFFEDGIDRGVLYLEDKSGVPWSGLTSVEENLDGDSTEPLYIDGQKYHDRQQIGDFSAMLKAYTYPDEFLEYDGLVEVGKGLFADAQKPKMFGLSYRTRVEGDADNNFGYKIHILYNLTALQDNVNRQTNDENTSLIDFTWGLQAVPEPVSGYRSTAHIIIDARYIDRVDLLTIEDVLYGKSNGAGSRLPSIIELLSMLGGDRFLIIVPNPSSSLPSTKLEGDLVFSVSNDTVYSWGPYANTTRPVFVIDGNSVNLLPISIKDEDIVYDETSGTFYKLGV